MVMDKKEALIYSAEIGADIPELDLHGFYVKDALEKLESFIFQNYKSDSVVRIIYGGGTGRLEEAVTEYLKKHPQVEKILKYSGNCLVVF
ncbi:MAG: hypothetical protein GF349_02745 [Candidatus Magasanikbacteria bacterium]|nr:hypothetical protein [Candidatus Magasanikbacteria bacterium]